MRQPNYIQLKIAIISDTHGQHDKLTLAPADMIIHSGDVSSRGRRNEAVEFIAWFQQLNFKHKIFVAGNHDFYFENSTPEEISSIIPKDIIYLNDESVTIDGIKIWGSPITPWFYDWAFNRYRGKDIDQHWQKIPAGADIVITHGPVEGILDRTIVGDHAGCSDLKRKMLEIKPRLHICGHIHEAYGVFENGDTTFVNASVLDERYRLKNLPVYLEL